MLTRLLPVALLLTLALPAPVAADEDPAERLLLAAHGEASWRVVMPDGTDCIAFGTVSLVLSPVAGMARDAAVGAAGGRAGDAPPLAAALAWARGPWSSDCRLSGREALPLIAASGGAVAMRATMTRDGGFDVAPIKTNLFDAASGSGRVSARQPQALDVRLVRFDESVATGLGSFRVEITGALAGEGVAPREGDATALALDGSYRSATRTLAGADSTCHASGVVAVALAPPRSAAAPGVAAAEWTPVEGATCGPYELREGASVPTLASAYRASPARGGFTLHHVAAGALVESGFIGTPDAAGRATLHVVRVESVPGGVAVTTSSATLEAAEPERASP